MRRRMCERSEIDQTHMNEQMQPSCGDRSEAKFIHEDSLLGM